MGAQCCCDADHRQINAYMNDAQQRDRQVSKLLLLGPGSTGKSTILKSLQMVHSGGTLSKDQRTVERRFIRANLLDAIKTLLEQSEILYERDSIAFKDCKLNKTDNNVSIHYDFITMQHVSAMTEEKEMSKNELLELGTNIKIIWNLPCIQATYNLCDNNFAISDNLQHFFDKIDTIFQADYIPTEEDCLKNRNKTTGMFQYQYQVSSDESANHTNTQSFMVVDVGGQRTERKKWIKCFDNVNGLLYVSSLVDYNRVLYEDSNVNAMQECVKLFENIMSLECFDNCAIILILNKNDLLEELLKNNKNNGLAQCFSLQGKWPKESEYWDQRIDDQFWPLLSNDEQFKEYHSIVIEFITKLYLNRNHKVRQIFRHCSIATNTDTVKEIFEDIQVIVVTQNLQSIAFDVGSHHKQQQQQQRNNTNSNNNNNNSNNNGLETGKLGVSSNLANFSKEQRMRVDSATNSMVDNEDSSRSSHVKNIRDMPDKEEFDETESKTQN